MTDPHQITAELTRRRLSRALRQHAGQGREWSAEMLAEESGIDVRTIRSYMAGENAPCSHKLLRLMAALPDSFASSVVELAGYSAQPTGEDTACTLAVNAHAAALVALIGEHLEDGQITPLEWAQQAAAVRRLMSTLQAFLNAKPEEVE